MGLSVCRIYVCMYVCMYVAGAVWIGEQGTLHDTTAQGIYVCVCTRACTRECTYVCDGICVPQVAFRTKFVATHVAESFAQASE